MFLGEKIFAVATLYFVLGWWRFGQTVGKWLFRVRVRSLENKPVALWRCAVRAVTLSWGPLLLGGISVINHAVYGVWGIGDAGPNQPNHPPLAKVFGLMAALIFLVYVVGLVWAGIRRHKRAWHDLVAGTMVVYHLPSAGGRSRGRAGAFGLGPLSRTSSRDR